MARPHRLCDQRRIDPLFRTSSGPIQHALPRASYIWPNLIDGFNGIACIHSQVTEAMIPDTKETTYLVGEKYMSPENYIIGRRYHAANDPGDLYSAMSGDDVSLIRWGNTSLLPSMDRTGHQQSAPALRRRSSAARTAPAGTRPFATGTCS